jgi:predicted DNA binding CopG/RHH family protein
VKEIIMAKLGRPKTDNPKNKIITVRLRGEDFNALKKYVSEHNITITEAIVRAIKLMIEKQ